MGPVGERLRPLDPRARLAALVRDLAEVPRALGRDQPAARRRRGVERRQLRLEPATAGDRPLVE